jgi:putative FmdB family regulatory protein
MPIREYTCTQCGRVSELLVGIGRNSDDIACKFCGSTTLEQRLSVPAPPQIQSGAPHAAGSTCCGGTPSDKGCVPGSCCGGG